MRPVTLVLFAMLLASCGGKELSHDGFVEAVEGTCENANRQLDLLDRPTDDASAQGFLERSLRINEDSADGIRALKAPEQLRSARDRLVAAMDEANGGLADAIDARAREDEDALDAAIERLNDGRAAFEAVVVDLGVDACRAGEPSPAPS